VTNMSRALPIEDQEGERLELKSLAALREPEKIARGAVAMLNSNGGDLWIGVKEGHGKNEIEAIPEADRAERERQRLQDFLLDVIEPTPLEGEVTVTAEPIESEPEKGGRVLRVALQPVPARRPYALQRHGGRFFLRRFGNRTVPMSRSEIVEQLRGPSASVHPDSAREKLQTETREILKRETGRMWLGIEPEMPGDLKLRELKKTELLADPLLSGTPRSSFNFAVAGYRGAAVLESFGGRSALRMGDDVLSFRISRSGGVRFEAALNELWAGRVPFVDAGRLVSPEALLGYLVSVVRLVRAVLGEPSLWHHPPAGDVWAGLAITGLRGWGLLPGNLAEWPIYRYQVRRFQDQDLLLEEPLRFTQDDLRERPDECGMRLVERIYDAFEIDLLPSISGAALGHAGLPALGRNGYSKRVSLDLGGGTRKMARLRADNLRPSRFEWETDEGDLIPTDGRWVHGWRFVE
jgi:Putative DNA-binding domain